MQQKNMHFLNEYIIVSSEAAGIIKKIDNEKLFAHYSNIRRDMIAVFEGHPIFWMHTLTDSDIKKLVEAQSAIIKKGISECINEALGVSDYFDATIKTFDESGRIQEFGPLLFETIRRYGAIIDRIKQLERAAISWLKAIEATKDQPPKSNLFKRIPVQQREVIRRYLQEQNAKEAAIKREADRAAAEAVAALVAAQKKLKKDKIRASKLAAQEKEQAELLAAQEKEQAELLSGGSSSSSSYMGATPQPKIKIKTRPSAASGASAAAASIIEDDEESDEDTQEFMLPPQLRNDAFKALIKSLTDETNERRLKQLVIRLNKDYGVFVETDEKKNKGYFAVRSPITNQLHVRTYHHLHNDNPYGSIFIALRDVLQAADLR